MKNDELIQLHGELFEAVQLQKIFVDSKLFVDSVPKKDPSLILHQFRLHREDKDFNLTTFITENFILPTQTKQEEAETTNRSVSMGQYIQDLWPILSRKADTPVPHSTLIPLPYPYIVPGGRFREIYYWDSYFTALGLARHGQWEMIENMVKNFAFLIDSLGHIPNGNRLYYVTRSHPPVFCLFVKLLSTHDPSALHRYLPQLKKEYAYWMQGEQKITDDKPAQAHVVKVDKYYVNRYYDEAEVPREEGYRPDVEVGLKVPDEKRFQLYRNLRAGAESGWDFSGRWFKDYKTIQTIRTTYIIPIDLNAILYLLEMTLSQLTTNEESADYTQRATARKDFILKYFWNEKDHFFFDYCFIEGTQTSFWSLAPVWLLYAQLLNDDQAKALATHLEKKFLKKGGLVTSLHETGEQWDYPNGWAPLQWIAVRGLENYGYTDLAREIASRWLQTCETNYAQTGTLFEKYDVVQPDTVAHGGEYEVQTGFGWTNGVAIDLAISLNSASK